MILRVNKDKNFNLLSIDRCNDIDYEISKILFDIGMPFTEETKTIEIATHKYVFQVKRL